MKKIYIVFHFVTVENDILLIRLLAGLLTFLFCIKYLFLYTFVSNKNKMQIKFNSGIKLQFI